MQKEKTLASSKMRKYSIHEIQNKAIKKKDLGNKGSLKN